MSAVEEIERVIEHLPAQDFEKLSAWMDQRRVAFGEGRSTPAAQAFRDHRAFLNSYTPEDEGLYDHAEGR